MQDQEPERFMATSSSFFNIFRRYPPSESWEQLNKISGQVEVGQGLLEVFLELRERGDDSWKNEWAQTMTKLGSISKEIEELWETHALREGIPMLHHEPHFLWVDAICINQGDLRERAEQVKLMRKIYKEAKSLTVWLGPEHDDSRTAFAVLRKFEKDRTHIPGGPFEIDAILPRLVDPEQAWLAIQMLFRRPWFSRAWILQEYALGGQYPTGKFGAITFCCGKERMFNLVTVGIDVWKQIRREDLEFGILQKLLSLRLLQQNLLAGRHAQRLDVNQYQLLATILQSTGVIATDPRDQIYAFLGLAEEIFSGAPVDFASKALILDYSAAVEDVYSSFVRAVVEATKRLDILGICYRLKAGVVQRTWTPDWTVKFNPGMLVFDIMGSGLPQRYEFTYDVTPGVDCIARFADNLSTLAVTGFVWDQIDFVSSIPSSTEPDSEVKFKKDCRQILSQVEETRGEDQGQAADFEDVFLKTLVWNIDDERNGKIIPDTWKKSFRRWIMDETLTGTNTIPRTVSGDAEILTSTSEAVTDDDSEFTNAFHKSMGNTYRVILTHGGYIGRSRDLVQAGDIACILLGCAMPMILRPIDGHYELVAEAYVPGIMHGEAMTALEEGRKTLLEFELR